MKKDLYDYESKKSKKYSKLLDKNLQKNFNILMKGKLPSKYIEGPLLTFDSEKPMFYWRKEYNQNFGYPLYAKNWIKPLARFIGDKKCLEIMAGTGFLSYSLSLYGVNITATDNFWWKNNFKNFYDVEKLDCISAIEKYKDVDYIIISWPCIDNFAAQAIKTIKKVNPTAQIIYIGEEFGGCTADDEFFNITEKINNLKFENAVKYFRSWDGIHDRILLLKPKN